MKRILGKSILFVTAHPDDESYLAAGTMLKNHDAGGKSYVACATFGEKGKSHLKKTLTSRQLKMQRKKELLAASKFLKVSKLLMPGLPDAGLGMKSNQDAFFKKLLPFVKKLSPELIISFGKDGISGHMDHISVGKVAKEVARKLKIRFLTFSTPPELYNSMEGLKKRRKHGKYSKRIKHQPHDTVIKVNPIKKLKALRFHKSQFGVDGPFEQFSPKAMKQMLHGEYFSS
jgi:LmbE family N-acetylglucosaminyl deacetylase